MKRLGIKETKAWFIDKGFSEIKPEHRNRATRVSRFSEYRPEELVRRESMKFDCLSWHLFSRPAYNSGRKSESRFRILILKSLPKPKLPE